MKAPIGICIISPSYKPIGKEAVRRFKKHSGLREVHVVRVKDEQGYEAKLSLDKIAGNRRFIAFDADWWALRDFHADQWEYGTFSAVPDYGIFDPSAFPREDCEKLGIRKETYANTGLIAGDGANPLHRAVYQQARRLWKKHQRTPLTGDPGEQTLWNLARQQVGAPIIMLPFTLSFYRHMVSGGCYPWIPAEVVGLHAAGVPLKDKLRHLQIGAEWLTYPPVEVQQDAMRHDWATTNQLR